MKKTCEKVAQYSPDIILSTRHFVPDDIQLAYRLGVPVGMVHCDFEFNHALKAEVGKVDPRLVKFCLPDNNPEIFLSLSNLLKSEMTIVVVEWDAF